ncbi:MAG: hypothetical protein U9Q07_11735 [Planctomycetota bacterium]|nr:hypothetical protein [Planctomycetota bacterium]
MHCDHDIFFQGIEQKRKLRLTFLSDDRGTELVRQCAPLHYSGGRADDLECYYLWDFEADEGYNFTALSPLQIVGMELTGDAFSLEEIYSLVSKPRKSTNGPYEVSG